MEQRRSKVPMLLCYVCVPLIHIAFHYRPLLNTFLKDICCLKNINLSDIDYRSEEAYCFFANVYHALLLHSRLLLGLPCSADHPSEKSQDVSLVLSTKFAPICTVTHRFVFAVDLELFFFQ